VSPLERLRAANPSQPWSEVASRDSIPCIEVAREDLKELCRTLRDECGFETVTFVTAVDRTPAEPRFEVCHQLLSVRHGDRLRLRTRVTEADPAVPTVADLWPGAAYSERECYDMFGVRFDGHRGLKRLLMPDGYHHHPLRKEFPHRGIEPDRLYREWDRGRRVAEGSER